MEHADVGTSVAPGACNPAASGERLSLGIERHDLIKTSADSCAVPPQICPSTIMGFTRVPPSSTTT
jgi:hypothetical protein